MNKNICYFQALVTIIIATIRWGPRARTPRAFRADSCIYVLQPPYEVGVIIPILQVRGWSERLSEHRDHNRLVRTQIPTVWSLAHAHI